MPILSSNPVSSQPSNSLPTVGERAFGVVQGIAETYSQPVVDVFQNLRYLAGQRAQPLNFPAQSPPWKNYVETTRYSQLKIHGIEIPIGAVLTHCLCQERTEYSARPLSDFNQASYKLQAKYVVNKADGKLSARKDSVTIQQSSNKEAASRTEEGRAIIAAGNAELASKNQWPEQLTAKFQPELDALAGREGMDRMKMALNKTYVGDFLPRQSELRFVLQDVVEPGPEAQPGTLQMGRYEVLRVLRSMFCANPAGVLHADVATDTRTMAAKINAANLAGRIVVMDLMGLQSYGVKSWVTVDFRHQEVPDSDQIAVRVLLVEFEAMYETSFPKIDEAGLPATRVPVGPIIEPRLPMSTYAGDATA